MTELLSRLTARFLEEDHHDHDEVYADEHNDGEEHHDDHGATMTTANSSGDNKPWAEVVLAAFLVNLATLSGVIIVAFTVIIPRRLSRMRRKYRQSHASATNNNNNDDGSHNSIKSFILSPKIDHLILPSFAAGALIATSVFLIIPECLDLLQAGAVSIASEYETAAASAGEEDTHDGHDHRRFLMQLAWRWLQQDHDDHNHEESYFVSNSTESAAANQEDGHEGHGHDDHSSAFWKFGASVLGGYLLPFAMASLFPVPHMPDEECEECRVRAIHESMRLEESHRLSLLREQETLLHTTKGCCKDGHCHRNLSRVSEQSTNLDSQEEEVSAVDDEESVQEEINVDDMVDATEKKMEDVPTVEVGGDKTLVPLVDSELGAAPSVTPAVAAARPVDWPLAISILVGDGFHNFTDGIFIGNAFLFCERQVAFTIIAATLYHELAQEVADFCLLTQHCHLPTWKALALNFVSGFSVLAGALLILALGMSKEATGVILAISAGVYLNIGATEVIPRVFGNPNHKNLASKAIFFVSFACGAIPIGLVLINHSHGCS